MKAADEIRQIAETDIEGNLGNRVLAVGEPARRMPQARTKQVLMRRDAQHAGEKAQEMKRAQRLRVSRSLAHKRCQPLFAATAAARGRIAPPIRVIDAEVARKRPVLAFSVISCPLMRPARPLRTHLSPNR